MALNKQLAYPNIPQRLSEHVDAMDVQGYVCKDASFVNNVKADVKRIICSTAAVITDTGLQDMAKINSFYLGQLQQFTIKNTADDIDDSRKILYEAITGMIDALFSVQVPMVPQHQINQFQYDDDDDVDSEEEDY